MSDSQTESDARAHNRRRAVAWQPNTACTRGAAAAVLGGTYLVAGRRAVPSDPAGTRTPSRGRVAAGALCAGGGPALLVARYLGNEGTGWQPPPSTAGRLLLGAYVLAGAVLEEALWRGPLILFARRTGARCAAWRVGGPAVLSTAGFLALHVRRDGPRSLPAHLTTTASWTVSALLGRRLRWPVLAHAGYNFAALSLRAAGTPAS